MHARAALLGEGVQSKSRATRREGPRFSGHVKWTWEHVFTVGAHDYHSDLYSAVLLDKLCHVSISHGAERCGPSCPGVKQL